MKIEILDQQSLYRLDETRLVSYCDWVMEQVSALAPEFQWQELSVVLTDDSIRDLNREWFGKDTVTDVISFAYTEPEASGELIVNVQQACEEGKLRKSPDWELALYLAHGCHHLMGAEDDTPARKKNMLALETRWVDKAFRQSHGPFFL
ncbi:MAG: rRNA maturation RNase YbeY [Kiritimatiellia bacterium]